MNICRIYNWTFSKGCLIPTFQKYRSDPFKKVEQINIFTAIYRIVASIILTLFVAAMVILCDMISYINKRFFISRCKR